MGAPRRNPGLDPRLQLEEALRRYRRAFRWDFRCSGLCFETRPGTYNHVTLLEFLTDLRRAFRGRRVILVWDGLPSHKSRAMQAYLQAQRSWLTVERLPGYAPELNPAEFVWGTSRAPNSPTSAQIISARSSAPCMLGCGGSAARPPWRSRFSTILGFLFDRTVTVLHEIQ